MIRRPAILSPRPAAPRLTSVVALSLLAVAVPARAADLPPRVICAVPEASAQAVQPATRDQACAELARLLGVGAAVSTSAAPPPPADPGLEVILHLTEADGRRLAGWIDWTDRRPGAAPASGQSRPAAAFFPDRAARAPFPPQSLTRFLTRSLREAGLAR